MASHNSSADSRFSSLGHLAGTCKVGAASDRLAVVDAKLRLRGVENVRIGDASVMPAIVSGNTNAPTIMIAERAASFLLEEKR